MAKKRFFHLIGVKINSKNKSKIIFKFNKFSTFFLVRLELNKILIICCKVEIFLVIWCKLTFIFNESSWYSGKALAFFACDWQISCICLQSRCHGFESTYFFQNFDKICLIFYGKLARDRSFPSKYKRCASLVHIKNY